MTDYIIIGHGLAGSVMAHHLIARGQKVEVFEAELPHSASAVSVGLVNPLIGPKLNPPFMITECLIENELFFRQCERAWGRKFYQTIPLHRLFMSEKQKKAWNEMEKNSDFISFQNGQWNSVQYQKIGILAEHGGGITKNAWQLDVPSFLGASKEYLIANNSWRNSAFEKGSKKEGQKIIFCEGFRVQENPWFKDLPFAPARGEVLTVQSKINLALSNGSWHLPGFADYAYLGSTWDHQNLFSGPTENGKKEILRKCNFVDFSKKDFPQHLSGVRSGTKDRQPIIGVHPDHGNLFLFNGFGSRGTSTIPHYAKKMTDFLLKNKPLPTESNLNRFI
ncbi:MAG: FAD-dependent oxidoreductase [Opitutales bacterium]|nr:FAD-dependent oxidoreductase [Opitutales bacterium]